MAGHVVLAAGAIETARILLLSGNETHPDGLGNGSGNVGRHLQGHLYVGAYGLFDEPVHDMRGPGVRIATCDFNHGNAGSIGGGVIANEVVKLPALFWHWALPPGAPKWGLAAKEYMRDAYLRTSHLFGPVQEIPAPGARITLARGVLDGAGLPVARLEGRLHPETLRTAEHQQARAREWLTASGAKHVWSPPFSDAMTAGQHQAGTCRMGRDPAASVTDPWGRVHGFENLWIMDASTHVTNGGFNPVLTIYALAFRNAEHLAQMG
jgi:choline dehydrogenase-like flavoprotein